MSELTTDAKLLHRLRAIQDRKERDTLAAKDAEIARIMAAVGKIEALLEIPEDERGFDFGTINRAITAKDAQIAALLEKVAILEAEIRVMRKLPAAVNAALEMSGGVK